MTATRSLHQAAEERDQGGGQLPLERLKEAREKKTTGGGVKKGRDATGKKRKNALE